MRRYALLSAAFLCLGTNALCAQDTDAPAPMPDPDSSSPAIHFQGVSKVFETPAGGHTALRTLDLEVVLKTG